MKLLVTGAKGQLGQELVLMAQAQGHEVTGIDQQELDLSRTGEVAGAIAAFAADWVINCAAYTQVDKAEEDQERAYLVNRDAAGAVAEGARASGGSLLQVSTDFIFDGAHTRPYSEDAAPNPLGVYGASKWAGEQAVLQAMPEATIVRTAWVYGIHGHNFVKTILRLAAEREELGVVDDQIGTPSATPDISKAILSLITADAKGTWNFTNEGVASWYDFAHEIIDIARSLGFPINLKTLRAIPGEEFPTPAKRPTWSVLSKKKIRQQLDYDIPHWRTSLVDVLESLQE